MDKSILQKRMELMDLQQRSMIQAEEIYEDLVRRIEDLEYMPGVLISENDLCEQYNTSRHMVRGALAKLRERGLVEVYPQRGTFVSLIDMDYISEILFLRESVEQESAARILESGMDVAPICKKMRKSIEAQHACLKKKGDDSSKEFFKLDSAFHALITDAAGQSDVLRLLDDQMVHFRRWRNLEIRSLNRIEELVTQHENIVDALEKKKAPLLRKRLHEHLYTIELAGKVREQDGTDYFYK